MPDKQKRPGASRPFPNDFSEAFASECTALGVMPPVAVIAFRKWNAALDAALAIDVAPWPVAEAACAAIWAEWCCDEGGEL